MWGWNKKEKKHEVRSVKTKKLKDQKIKKLSINNDMNSEMSMYEQCFAIEEHPCILDKF